jgi:hypothetical protein
MRVAVRENDAAATCCAAFEKIFGVDVRYWERPGNDVFGRNMPTAQSPEQNLHFVVRQLTRHVGGKYPQSVVGCCRQPPLKRWCGRRKRRQQMSDDLTNDQIALLCDIGEHDQLKVVDEKQDDLQHLIAEGYVEPKEGASDPALQLTAKALAFLGARGAGLDEA